MNGHYYQNSKLLSATRKPESLKKLLQYMYYIMESDAAIFTLKLD
jgi:hypothetical protein